MLRFDELLIDKWLVALSTKPFEANSVLTTVTAVAVFGVYFGALASYRVPFIFSAL